MGLFKADYKSIDEKYWVMNKTLLEYRGEDEEVRIPDGIKKIGDMAFRCPDNKVKKVYLPDSVTIIGVGSFAMCNSLEYIEGRNVKSIYQYAFYNCKMLKKAYFPNLKIHYMNAFSRCFRLTLSANPKIRMGWYHRL